MNTPFSMQEKFEITRETNAFEVKLRNAVPSTAWQ